MCGRLNLRFANKALADVVGAILAPGVDPQARIRFDVTPGQQIPAIRSTGEPGERELVELGWGLILPFAKSSKDYPKPSNSRDDKLGGSMYSKLFREKRCVIPISEFYEWPVARDGDQVRTCLRRRDGQPIFVAGMWSRFTKEAEPIETTTMITTGPNDYTKQIHDRTIVILEDENAVDRWLDPTVTDPAKLKPLIRPCSEDLLEAFPVVWESDRPEALIEPTGAPFETDDPRLQNQLFVTEEMKKAAKKRRADAKKAAKKSPG